METRNKINMFEIWFIRWWRDLGFKDKLTFSRDRVMENYMWAVGIIFEPQFSKCRIGLTKFVCILLVIDDMYDVYGLLDELECFTDAVKRYHRNMIIKDTTLFYLFPNHHIFFFFSEFPNCHFDDKHCSFYLCFFFLPFIIFFADGKWRQWRTYPNTWRFAMLLFLTSLMKWLVMSSKIMAWILWPILLKR